MKETSIENELFITTTISDIQAEAESFMKRIETAQTKEGMLKLTREMRQYFVRAMLRRELDNFALHCALITEQERSKQLVKDLELENNDKWHYINLMLSE